MPGAPGSRPSGGGAGAPPTSAAPLAQVSRGRCPLRWAVPRSRGGGGAARPAPSRPVTPLRHRVSSAGASLVPAPSGNPIPASAVGCPAPLWAVLSPGVGGSGAGRTPVLPDTPVPRQPPAGTALVVPAELPPSPCVWRGVRGFPRRGGRTVHQPLLTKCPNHTWFSPKVRALGLIMG